MSEFNSVENEKQNKPSESKVFIILGIIFFVLGIMISLLQLLVSKDMISTTNSKLGYMVVGIIARIVLAIICAIVGGFIVKNKKGQVLMLISIIYLALSMIITANALVKRSEEVKLNKVAMSKFASIANDYSTGKDLSNEKFDKAKYGSLASFLTLSDQYFVSFKKMNTDLNTEIGELNLETILGADSYSSPETIKDSQNRLNTTLDTFNKFETNANKSIKKLQSGVNDLDLSPEYKKGFVAGFQKSQIESNSKFKNYMEIEKNIIKKMNELMSFMSTENVNYEVKDNRVYFKTNDTLDKYNKYIEDLQKLVVKETAAQKEMQDSVSKKIENLDKLTK